MSDDRTYLKVWGLGLTWCGGAAAVITFAAVTMGTTHQTMWATAATVIFTALGVICVGYSR